MTYLITFTCYGCHLHGDERGSVDRQHNLPGSPLVKADARGVLTERHLMDQPPYLMDERCRQAVLAAIVDRCAQQRWELLAAHVRTNHVHLVVEGETRPERIMNDLKSYASLCLNQMESDEPERKRWARHGSTRWLWEPENVTAAIQYVIDEQGEAMSVFRGVTAPFGRGSV